jgi:hypothetical protein
MQESLAYHKQQNALQKELFFLALMLKCSFVSIVHVNAIAQYPTTVFL